MFRKFVYEYDDHGHHYKRVYTHTILDYEELTEDESVKIRMEIYKDNKLVRKRWLKYAEGLESIVESMCDSGEKTIVYYDNEYKTAKIKLEEES